MSIDINQIITLLTSIAACLAAIATFLTVRQIAKQRKSSYRPELIVSRVLFHGLPKHLGMGPLPTYWTHPVEHGQIKTNLEWIKIPIYNIGLGAAKELNISWSFPIIKLTESVNEIAERKSIINPFVYENGVLILDADNIGHCMSSFKNQQKHSVDYVLPASVQNKPLLLDIPYSYILLCSALIFFKSKNEQKIPGEIFPSLKLEVEYLDVGGDKHKTSYEIALDIKWIGFESDGSITSFCGTLKSK